MSVDVCMFIFCIIVICIIGLLYAQPPAIKEQNKKRDEEAKIRKIKEKEDFEKRQRESNAKIVYNQRLRSAYMIQSYLKNNYFIHWHPNGDVYYYSRKDEDIDWFEKNFPIEMDENGNFIKEEFSMPEGLKKVPLVELNAMINRERSGDYYRVTTPLDKQIADDAAYREKITELIKTGSRGDIDAAKAQMLAQGMKTPDASVVGRAVAGGVVAGPTGAIVGAASAINKNMKK